jgi:acyl-CoA thioester hydrolase
MHYYSFADTTITRFLAHKAGWGKPGATPQQLHYVENGCRYFVPVSHPATLIVGLKVSKLGNSSITYRIGLFQEEDEETCIAELHSVHVAVNAATQQPETVSETLREAYQPIRMDL